MTGDRDCLRSAGRKPALQLNREDQISNFALSVFTKLVEWLF